MTIKQTHTQVLQWAKERELLKKATPEKQWIKYTEEVGEFSKNYLHGRHDLVKDDIGDIFVTIVIYKKLIGRKHQFGINTVFKHLTVEQLLRQLSDYCSTNDFPSIATNSLLNELAKKFNSSLEECFEIAYQEIKGRKGSMKDGSFIKEIS